jgi:hypothetical protein
MTTWYFERASLESFVKDKVLCIYLTAEACWDQDCSGFGGRIDGFILDADIPESCPIDEPERGDGIDFDICFGEV